MFGFGVSEFFLKFGVLFECFDVSVECFAVDLIVEV